MTRGKFFFFMLLGCGVLFVRDQDERDSVGRLGGGGNSVWGFYWGVEAELFQVSE